MLYHVPSHLVPWQQKRTVTNPKWGNWGSQEVTTSQGPWMSKRPSQDATPTESEARAQDPHYHVKSVTSSRPSPQSYKPEGRVGGRGEGKGGGVRMWLTVQHSFHYIHPVCLHTLTLRNFLDIRKETRHHKEVYRKLRMLPQYQKPQFPCWENEGYKWLLHAHLACSKHSWMVGIIVISKI